MPCAFNLDNNRVNLLISFFVISFLKYFSLINLFENPLIKYSPEDIMVNKFKVSFSKMLKPVYFLSLTMIEEDILLISETGTSSTFISGNASIYLLLLIFLFHHIYIN